MTITAAQIREARRLLRRSSANLAMMSEVEFTTVLKAQLDAEIGSVDSVAIQTLEQALLQAGIAFTPDGGVQMRKLRTSIPAVFQDKTKDRHD